MIHAPTYFVPGDENTWPDRMDAACRVLERRFGVSLSTASTGTKFNVVDKPVPDRPKFFRQRLKTKTRWLSLFCGTGYRRTPEGFRNFDYHSFGGTMYGDFGLFKALADYPEQPDDVRESVLAEMGDALGALSAQYTPMPAAQRLRQAHWCVVIMGKIHYHDRDFPDKTAEEARLPRICESFYTGLEHRLQPHHLGWLNYWSAEVCAYVGFPERLAGHPVMERCYRTPAGSWIVKLGDEPFTPGNAAQAVLLREMYERFPRVGVRLAGRLEGDAPL